MSATGWVIAGIGVWAVVASVRTARRIGLRRFSLAVGRLGWDLGKVALGGTAVVAGAVVASAARSADSEEIDNDPDPDLLDVNDLANFTSRPASPLWSGHDD